ncbi:hypothetical protein NEMBOFW57_006774 [Staphylotrichum longicolle]|uniref:Uncharacterized protein n=1 Tax=Staphylotrichum longicolle TaxID=669026 RepID=A0AAD4HWT6_9PEZI|nr:hypothetical protein NEMBOFW57_006774 [Staphylotrichum longicolle]
MSLTVASTFARGGRHPKALPPVALGGFGTATIPHHCRQQTRTYRFGCLSSYLEPYFRPDAYARHQSNGYKYCANLYRWRSCDKHTLAEDAKSTLKRAVTNYWSSDRRGSQGAGRYLNTHASPRRTPDNPEGIRPGQNIEDVERAPLEHLLFGGKMEQRAKTTGRMTQANVASALRDNADADFVIDPITNRKVFKESPDTTYSTSDQEVEIPIRKFKPYRSIFEPFRAPEIEGTKPPIFSDGPPPEAELKMYGQGKLWDPVTESHRAAADTQKKPPVINHYGAPRSTLLDTLNWKHEEVQWHRNDTISSSQHLDTPDYKDLHQYTAVRYQEPAGTPADEHPATKNEDLSKYGAVNADEPDGKYKTESEPPANPQELDLYGAVRSHEPDGRYKVEPDVSVDPQELNSYGAVRSHEPDGKYAAEYTEAPDEAELESYRKPFLSHEPDGRYAANHVEPEHDAEELAKYRQPFFSYEPDGKYAASYEEPQQDVAELSKYKAFRSHEPDGKYAVNHAEEKPNSDELATYGAFRSHEPDGKYAAHHPEKAEADELATYGAFRSHEPDGKYALRDSSPARPADAQMYQAFRSHEPDGKYAAEAETALDAQKEDEDLANHEAFGYEDVETRPLPQDSQPSKTAPDLEGYKTVPLDERAEPSSSTYEDYDPAELRKYQAVRWNEPDGKPTEDPTAEETFTTPYRKTVEELMAQAAAESDIPSSAARPMTGNYVRDFPEDFAKSWSTHYPIPEPSSTSGTVQPALDRCATTTKTPALYKILVYDPTMQSIATAETTSAIPDTATPLTPAEVLLRISNPAKFFPHFAPLRREGFEIVAGSGDVLIFRKVRDADVAVAVDENKEAKAKSVGVVNPIDMTGGGGAERRDDYYYPVAAGRFASPTGFVNYDLPPPFVRGAAHQQQQQQQQQAEAEAVVGEWEKVRKEEDGVGEGTGEQNETGTGRKKRSVVKRVAVGAVWVAGVSYALGVVGEYFRNGKTEVKAQRRL